MARLTATQIRKLDDMLVTRMARLDTDNGGELIAYAEFSEIRQVFEAMLTEGIDEQIEAELTDAER